MGTKATQEAAPCWSPLCSETDPVYPPYPFQHTHLFPFPTNPGGFLTSAIFLEKDRKLRGEAFQSPVLSLTRSIQGTGIQHGDTAVGGEEVGREQKDHSRSIQQCASLLSSGTSIDSFHRQHQGWDNGWDPWAATGAPNPVMQKLQKGTSWGKREFTGWNSSQGDYSVWLQHFNKSCFLGGKK